MNHEQEELEQRLCEICRARRCKFRVHEEGFEDRIESCEHIECLRACKGIFKFRKYQYQAFLAEYQ